MPKFTHQPLELLNPTFDSPLLDVLTELEHLRRLEVRGTTPPSVFLQLKHVFHILESLASARIEGNHTTLADYVDAKIGSVNRSDSLLEIDNIEAAMRHIEEVVPAKAPLTQHFVRDLHAKAVSNLKREGDRTPGAYRTGPVRIAQAAHLPPDAVLVAPYMEELTNFINADHPQKYDLMKVALAHHRFAWIHPFGNGNGRVVRLLTYAMLIKYGFRVDAAGRLLNPAAVFCADRAKYYSMLAGADSGDRSELENWCTYVLSGVATELKKIDQLANFDYLQNKILLPAVSIAKQRQLVTAQEEAVLIAAIKGGTVKSANLAASLPGMNSAQRTYQIKKLVQSGMLQPVAAGARQYTIGFSNNTLLRCVVRTLEAEDFIPPALSSPDRK